MSYTFTHRQPRNRQIINMVTSLIGESDQGSARRAELDAEIAVIHQRLREENEYLNRVLQKQEAAIRSERAHSSAAIRELDQQVKERERLQMNRINTMQREHTAQINRLQAEFQSEQEDLRRDINQTRSEMEHSISRIRVETDRKLEEQRIETRRNLDQMSQEMEGKINAVDQKVNTLAQRIAEKELAVYWAQEAARMLRRIIETSRAQLLDSRSIAGLERQIRSADNDIKGGQYQSAITAGRTAFFDALDMKEDIAVAEMEWNFHYNALMLREAELLEQLDSAENRVYQIKMDDELYEYSNGIDYWTFDQLSIVRDQINELRESLGNKEDMTTAELQSAEENVRSLQEQLALVENAAHINIAMSVSRYETAVRIGDILDSDYEMIESDGDFFAREDREEYHAVFQNPNTNDQIAVVITPIPDEAGVMTNHIELIVGNADNDPLTRDKIASEIAAKLRDSGVDGCSFPCSGRFGDQTAEEVERVGDINAVVSGDERARASLPEGMLIERRSPQPRVIRSEKK